MGLSFIQKHFILKWFWKIPAINYLSHKSFKISFFIFVYHIKYYEYACRIGQEMENIVCKMHVVLDTPLL